MKWLPNGSFIVPLANECWGQRKNRKSPDDNSQPPTGMTTDAVALMPQHRSQFNKNAIGRCEFRWLIAGRTVIAAPRDWFSFCISVISIFPAFFFGSVLCPCQLFFNYCLSWPVQHSINLRCVPSMFALQSCVACGMAFAFSHRFFYVRMQCEKEI